ncbi:peptide-methionine (S)-S-oxide reductase [Ostertagia ostertagi]
MIYRQVLDFFWSHHNPAKRRKKQYRSAILYETEDEKKIADLTYDQAKAKYGEIETYVARLEKFYQAEAYYQKYWLRNNSDIFDELMLNDNQIINSTLAAKMNAYCAGYTDFSELEELKKEHGLSDSLVERVKQYASTGGDPSACHYGKIASSFVTTSSVSSSK